MEALRTAQLEQGNMDQLQAKPYHRRTDQRLVYLSDQTTIADKDWKDLKETAMKQDYK